MRLLRVGGLFLALLLSEPVRVLAQSESLDHFAWSAIASPQATGVPFEVSLTALNRRGEVSTGFNGEDIGPLALSDDDRFLYVALYNHGGLARINLDTGQIDSRFSLGEDKVVGPLFAKCGDSNSQPRRGFNRIRPQPGQQ